MIKNNLLKNREFIITLTVVLSITLPFTINPDNFTFTIYYSLAFFLSFCLFSLCIAAIHITDSYRIIGLMILMTLNMAADLMTVFSYDLFILLEPIRYDNYYNFTDMFSTYEVVCVLFSISGGGSRVINRYRKWRDSNYNGGCVRFLCSHFSKHQ